MWTAAEWTARKSSLQYFFQSYYIISLIFTFRRTKKDGI